LTFSINWMLWFLFCLTVLNVSVRCRPKVDRVMIHLNIFQERLCCVWNCF
jgi:hypothetical protein